MNYIWCILPVALGLYIHTMCMLTCAVPLHHRPGVKMILCLLDGMYLAHCVCWPALPPYTAGQVWRCSCVFWAARAAHQPAALPCPPSPTCPSWQRWWPTSRCRTTSRLLSSSPCSCRRSGWAPEAPLEMRWESSVHSSREISVLICYTIIFPNDKLVMAYQHMYAW